MATPQQHSDRVERLYREHGMRPTWSRVWRNGVDVTAEPISSWVPPWSWYVEGRRGEAERQLWLQAHAEAIAEREGLA